MTGGQREFGKRGETKGRRSCGRKKKRRGGQGVKSETCGKEKGNMLPIRRDPYL
jgi:hypothetical protein